MEPTKVEPGTSGWVSPQGPPATPGAPAPPVSKRPWWKRKGGIAAVIVGVLVALGAIGSATNPKAQTTASESPTATLAEVAGSATATDAPAADVSPTPDPSSEASAEPAVAPTPQPKPIINTAGRGDKVVRFTAQDAPTVVRITGKGAGNFAVVSYAGATYGDLLVNEIGSYAGWVYVAAGINRLKISSSGSWTVEMRPITSARSWSGAGPIAGKGDTVVLLSGGASGATTIKSKGRSNFAVTAYSPEGDYLDLLVNEIGAYNGEVLLPEADPIVLVIHAVGGTWSMSAVLQ